MRGKDQYSGEPVPFIHERLRDIFQGEVFTARMTPHWPGAAQTAVLFFPERPAPFSFIEAWTEADGTLQVPERYYTRCTVPKPEQAGFVQAATLLHYGTRPSLQKRIWCWHDNKVFRAERERKWKAAQV